LQVNYCASGSLTEHAGEAHRTASTVRMPPSGRAATTPEDIEILARVDQARKAAA